MLWYDHPRSLELSVKQRILLFLVFLSRMIHMFTKAAMDSSRLMENSPCRSRGRGHYQTELVVAPKAALARVRGTNILGDCERDIVDAHACLN